MADVPAALSSLLSGRLFETISLIDADDLSDDERAAIPDWWLEAVHLPPRDGVARALTAWQSVLPDALPGLNAFLKERGDGVFLGRSASERRPLLAYAATLPSGDTVCWYGFPPTHELRHPALDLTKLPAAPRTLYTELHDGFKLASVVHNGFACSADWFAVGEDLDAESAEILGDTAAPDLDRLISLFFDFGASSVCVELGDTSDEDRSGWAISDNQLQPVDDIWPTIDRWMLSLQEP